MLKLKAKIRKKLNRNNLVPGILYGHKIKNILLEVNYSDFEQIYKQAGESSLVDLIIDNKKRTVLIHDVQTDPVTDKYLHVDFYQVKMDEKIKAEVALAFIGDAPGVSEHGGILVKNIDKLEVQALPKNLPHDIKVDVSKLKEIEDVICIKDLAIPKGAEVLAEKDQAIATVVAPKVEEEKEEEKKEGEESEEEKKEQGEEDKNEEQT